MTQRSHITQKMQNYFDATDIRTRENPVSLEAQLLNMAAVEIEDLQFRAHRETSQSLQTVPTNIDNEGVYYSVLVPDRYLTGPDQTSFDSVIGSNEQVSLIRLSLYNDTLPVPSRILLNQNHTVSLSNPVMFTSIGAGIPLSQTYAVDYVYPGIFPIANVLTLWVDQIGMNGVNITLTIIGDTYPQPAWRSEQKKTTETLNITAEGVATTINRWVSIDSIAIRNLPNGMRLRGWSMPFNLPASPDISRPYSTPEDRDIDYPRYWQISNTNNLLYEMYSAGGLTGLEVINSYSIPETMVDVAVEPFTNGMYVASGGNIYYADRREYMADLTQTGLSAEPLFGLQVAPDIAKNGPTRYVVLSGVPYANAGNIYQYRYTSLVSGSLNIQYSILPDGSIGPSNAGWRQGAPKPVSFALLSSGDYRFRLEMQDGNGTVTYDIVPYRNAAFAPLKIIDMESIVDSIKGIAFDSYGQLWVWNGLFAMLLDIHYDGYIFNASNKVMYLTELFSTVTIT